MIEPGTRLAGRYRLESPVSESSGSTLWKAIDEILARAVAVRTFDPAFPRIAEAVTAARAASRLTDPRLTQVFDADDSGDSAYVVSEWTTGESLEQMLAKAPLEPGRAATLLHEAAEAIAAAHSSGLAHLCLCPKDLLWTTGGTVKLLGIAVDAVLIDAYAEDSAKEDTQALGRMLYAAVTAHWPGEQEHSKLPAAPKDDEVWRAPRLVQAGVPQRLDAIICRTLGIPATGGEPLATPSDLVAALREVPRTPLPLFAGPQIGPPPAVMPRPAPKPAPKPAPAPAPAAQRSVPTATAFEPPPQATRPSHRGGGAPPRAAGRSGLTANPPLLALGAAALTVIVGLSAWALTRDDGSSGKGGTPPVAKTTQPKASVGRLPIQGAQAEQQARMPGSNDTTIGRTVDLIHDGDDSTIWRSQTYTTPEYGNLMSGMGVLLDMGSSVTVDHINLKIPGSGAGATLELRIGDQNSRDMLQKAGTHTTGSGTFEVKPNAGATRGRYILLWFTKAPPGGRLEVGEAIVFGSK